MSKHEDNNPDAINKAEADVEADVDQAQADAHGLKADFEELKAHFSAELAALKAHIESLLGKKAPAAPARPEPVPMDHPSVVATNTPAPAPVGGTAASPFAEEEEKPAE